MHVRQVRAERALHDPAQPRQRRRPWADEQLLPRAGQQVGMWLLCPSHLSPRTNYTLLHTNFVPESRVVKSGLVVVIFLYFRINCNIFSYDYSGYGVSGGKPSEKNLYADIEVSLIKLKRKR